MNRSEPLEVLTREGWQDYKRERWWDYQREDDGERLRGTVRGSEGWYSRKLGILEFRKKKK